MAGTIVLGYDASPGARGALEQAIALAREFGDKLVIAYGVAPAGNVGEEWRANAAALEEHGRGLTSEALEAARAAGLEAEVALVPERPHSALLTLASAHDARYIVVGGWGESPIRGAILGSTPHKLLHLSDRPVLVVPA
jgi:nucleotide-binding universal stress UspA family protein